MDHWYRKGPLVLALLPLSGLYCLAMIVRRACYRIGLLPSVQPPVPVIVVGNLTVGGTGKTPLVVWLVRYLKAAGYHPGVVSRGYGGNARHWPQQVRGDSDPDGVGDEPVLLARHCACPVAVGPSRVAAVRALLDHHACDVIVSDDGLQHYRLGRTVELAVVDGDRRFGNGHCLPAGPLREPRLRLRKVDAVVVTGSAGYGEHTMRLVGDEAFPVGASGQGRRLSDFAGAPVHAVAAIGHPERFFERLRQAGLQVTPHAFTDHHRFRPEDLDFATDAAAPVLMTEKDAVKCERFARPNWWYLSVRAEPDGRLGERILALLPADGARRAADAHEPHGQGIPNG